MSMATLERAVLAGARVVFNNPKLKNADIQEWSTGKIDPQIGESVAHVDDPGVWVAVKTQCDKRAK